MKRIHKLAVALASGTALFALSGFAAAAFEPLGAPGCARSIGVGNSDKAWVIGCDSKGSAGYGIYRWTGSAWSSVVGAAMKVAVSPEGTPWVVNGDGVVYKWNGSAFKTLPAPGCAREIGVGSYDKAWVIGCDRVGEAGYGIYRWTGSSWSKVFGSAVKIAVSPEGTPWVVNGYGTIYKWNGSAFMALPATGCAREIGVGNGNAAWAIGCDAAGSAGNSIYHWTGSAWSQVAGAAVVIAVSPSGTPWVVNAEGSIYKWK